jgi:hypothetical protein
MNAADEFEKIRQTWTAAELRSEGGNPAVYLPRFPFNSGGQPVTMDLLLYPHTHGGSYVTRLFFKDQLSRGPNWASHFICGGTWWAPSWKDVHPGQPWASMLANHLRAVE